MDLERGQDSADLIIDIAENELKEKIEKDK